MRLKLEGTTLTIEEIAFALRLLAQMADECETVEEFMEKIRVWEKTYKGMRDV